MDISEYKMKSKRKYMTPGTKIEKKSRWEPRAEFKARLGAAGRAALNIRTAGLLGMEYKAFDAVRSATAIANSDTWAAGIYEVQTFGLFCPVQGNGIANRDGNKVIVKSILVQGVIKRVVAAAAAASRQPSIVQVALVMDRQTNGAQMLPGDVYTSVAPCVPGQRVLEYSRRFKVLKTVVLRMNDVGCFNDAAGTGAVTGNCMPFTFAVKLNEEVAFITGAGAGAVADLKDVSFHIIAATSGAANVETIEYNSRIRFVG